MFYSGAEGEARTRTPIQAQRPQRCLSTNSNTSAILVWQEREDSNPRPKVLETFALPTELRSYIIKKL